jgi:hypothetical protein
MEWAQAHQDELRENWERARAHEQLAAVDPLPWHSGYGRGHPG